MRTGRLWSVVTVVLGALALVAWYERGAPSPAPKVRLAFGQSKPTLGPVAAAPTPSVPARGTRKSAANDIEVCGIGVVHLDRTDRAAPFDYVNRLTSAAQLRWRHALIDSDDNRVRAAGLMLLSEGWDFDPVTHMPARTEDAQLARDELVQMASGLDDLTIYAMAVNACDPTDDGGVRVAACDRISLAKWAAMDSDNAAPWLELAAVARERSDLPAEIAAIGHAAQAHKIDTYHDSLLAYAEAGMPLETTGLEQAAFVGSDIGHVGSDGHLHSFAMSYCNVEALQQSSIAAQCEALAELFMDHGRNALDLSVAQRIGARLGWSPARLDELEEEMLAVFRVETSPDDNPWSCDNVTYLNRFAGTQAHSGELAAARAAIARSGKSIGELAQEQRDWLQKSAERVSAEWEHPESP
jgi:hypothetical protein